MIFANVVGCVYIYLKQDATRTCLQLPTQTRAKGLKMTKTAYEKHTQAFAHVTAGVIMKDGKHVGDIAFKFPRDGAGRLSCFLHLHRWPMVVGTASGYGYDKKSAAFESACRFLTDDCLAEFPTLIKIDCEGMGFESALKSAGFEYLGAV